MPAAKNKKKKPSRNEAQTENFKKLYGTCKEGKTARAVNRKVTVNRILAERTTLMLAASASMAMAIRKMNDMSFGPKVTQARKEMQEALKQYDDACRHREKEFMEAIC